MWRGPVSSSRRCRARFGERAHHRRMACFLLNQSRSNGRSCHVRESRAEGERRQVRDDEYQAIEFGRAEWCRVFAVIPCSMNLREARNRPLATWRAHHSNSHPAGSRPNRVIAETHLLTSSGDGRPIVRAELVAPMCPRGGRRQGSVTQLSDDPTACPNHEADPARRVPYLSHLQVAYSKGR